ncbi:Protein of uncharacterised function (DUF3027) [Actinomyces bovis]|uniref:Protein of uncharacterized function (DUF3027) n=1 Tax=Actinomyces bovis TaxID=1658 RepID=A0ABY1VS56_9ACTO|nr:DUF3027 domain-containing protein [Actinomyces bovis]SPT54237.1 Protein of uncharacterised function (DUF3027) [Actinomyces bovis]VEG56480.1 Protein of uncharacterised function (DUF3027) [Actinomyces israelii]
MTDTATQTPPPTAADLVNARPASERIARPGSLPTPVERAAAAKDKTLTSAAAIELARQALGEITEPLSVGLFAASKAQAERLITHLFECNLAGYRGWRWAVTMSRPPRSRTATICEMELLPGEDALLAPAWVPWADRLQPGDVSRSDRLPKRETDERLEPGWEATGEDADALALDVLDLGRPRVLSPEGIQRAAQRWYDGEHGPDADGVRRAHATCSTCGFFMPLSGPMRNVFGVCANEWAADDGTVVSLDHGCGAHSETDLPDQGPEWPVTPSRLDETEMVPVATDGLALREGVPLAELQAAEAAEAAKAAAESEAEQLEETASVAAEAAELPSPEQLAVPTKSAKVDVPTAVTPDEASTVVITATTTPTDPAAAACAAPAEPTEPTTSAAPPAEPAAPPRLELDLPEPVAAAPRKRRRRAAKLDDQDTAKALADLESSLPSR